MLPLKNCSKGVPLNGLSPSSGPSSSGPPGLSVMRQRYLSTPRLSAVDVLRLVDIRDTPLDVAEVTATLDDASSGGLAVFVGRVRDHDGGQDVTGLEYAAHPSALDRLRDVCAQVASTYDVTALAAVAPHRSPGDRRHRGHLRHRDGSPRRGVRGDPRAHRHPQGRGADLEAPDVRRRHRGVGRLTLTRAAVPARRAELRPYPVTRGDPPVAGAAGRRDAAGHGLGVVAGARGPRRGRPRGGRPSPVGRDGQGPSRFPAAATGAARATGAPGSPSAPRPGVPIPAATSSAPAGPPDYSRVRGLPA